MALGVWENTTFYSKWVSSELSAVLENNGFGPFQIFEAWLHFVLHLLIPVTL